MTAEPTAVRASARVPNGMLTTWATPSATDAAATPASIRSFAEGPAIPATLLAPLSASAKVAPHKQTSAFGTVASATGGAGADPSVGVGSWGQSPSRTV
ncbi:hypothetical protein NJB1604_44540 [Mycobacterium marinum]|nr:hypothetical protein NJB1604_44540 [Mycobacterium marinum]